MGWIQTAESLPVPGIDAELGQVLGEKSFDLFPNFIELCECAHRSLWLVLRCKGQRFFNLSARG
jgi:hypothetical protein